MDVARPPALHRLALVVASSSLLAACASEGVVGSIHDEGKRDTQSPSAPAPSDTPGPGDPEPLGRSDVGIGAGGASTCALTGSGGVRCWGENGTGSLGLGDPDIGESADPVTPKTLIGVYAAIASGRRQQCALRNDGKLFCWGDMYIGDTSWGPVEHLPVMNPLPMDGFGDLARVSVGDLYTCGITTNGELSCSGMNDRGQLGIGTTDPKPLPTRVSLDGAATSVSASMGAGATTCATTQPGSVYCWGASAYGEAGPGETPVLAPRKIEGLPPRAVEVVVGGGHACARFVTGDVRCWGDNSRGQLGTGDKMSSAAPVTPLYLSDIVKLAAGSAHTCALHRSGAVFCFGDNTYGEVGDNPEPSHPMMVVDDAFGVKDVTAGLAHTCVRSGAGKIRCFGANTSGQLGSKKDFSL